MTIEESADTGSANTAAASDMASADAASPDSVIAAYPEGEIDSAFSYDEKSDSGDYSSTNTQEEMVDEADIVKTDGTYIYAMDSKGTIRIVDAASMKLIGTINGENSADYKEMYVEGSCLQLIRQQVEYVTYKGELNLPSTSDEDYDNDSTQSVRSSYSMPVTIVSVFDIRYIGQNCSETDRNLSAGRFISLIQTKQRLSVSLYFLHTGYGKQCRSA